jgi:hypothetical protein
MLNRPMRGNVMSIPLSAGRQRQPRRFTFGLEMIVELLRIIDTSCTGVNDGTLTAGPKACHHAHP